MKSKLNNQKRFRANSWEGNWFCSQKVTSGFVVKKLLTRDNQVGLEETSLYFKLFTEISFPLLFFFFTKEHIFFFCSSFFYGKDTIYIYIIISKTWVYHNKICPWLMFVVLRDNLKKVSNEFKTYLSFQEKIIFLFTIFLEYIFIFPTDFFMRISCWQISCV